MCPPARTVAQRTHNTPRPSSLHALRFSLTRTHTPLPLSSPSHSPPLRVQVRNLLVAERARLLAALRTVPFLEPYASSANFILAKVGNRVRGLGF